MCILVLYSLNQMQHIMQNVNDYNIICDQYYLVGVVIILLI